MEEIKELVRISNEIGRFKELVQASGGNTSVKTLDEKMVIKASGFMLSEITENSGFAVLDYNKIIEFLENEMISDAEQNEKLYNNALMNSLVSFNELKPSLETGMHALLDRVVIHSHPVMVSVITCMNNGESVIRDMFSNTSPEILWVSYKYPGYHLAKELKKRISEYKNKNGVKPEIIFLKNHGLTVSSNNPRKCVEMTMNVNEKIHKYLKDNFRLEDFPEIRLEPKDKFHFSTNEIIKSFNDLRDNNVLSSFISPDDVVYCSREFVIHDKLKNFKIEENKINLIPGEGVIYPWGERESTMINEVLTTKLYIAKILSEIGKIDFLSEGDVNYIRNMESEKYRQGLN